MSGAYRHALKSLFEDVRAREDSAAFEVQMGVSEAEIAAPFNRFRMDSAFARDGQLSFAEAVLSDPSTFEPLRELWNGVTVELRPLVWNDVIFEVEGAVPSEAKFGEWLHRWTDADSARSEDEDGLLGVVHRVSPPEVAAREWVVSVDFGSSDIAAFAAFFELLRHGGATRVMVYSEQAKDGVREV